MSRLPCRGSPGEAHVPPAPASLAGGQPDVWEEQNYEQRSHTGWATVDSNDKSPQGEGAVPGTPAAAVPDGGPDTPTPNVTPW